MSDQDQQNFWGGGMPTMHMSYQQPGAPGIPMGGTDQNLMAGSPM